MSEFLKPKPLGVVGNTMDTKENVSAVTKSLMQPTIDRVQDATKDFVVNNIPEKLHTTLGLSYTLVKGAIDKGYDVFPVKQDPIRRTGYMLHIMRVIRK